MIQSTSLDLDNNLVRSGMGLGAFAQLKSSGRAVSDEGRQHPRTDRERT